MGLRLDPGPGLVGELEIDLVHEGGRLQRVLASLATHPAFRHVAEIVVDHRVDRLDFGEVRVSESGERVPAVLVVR